MNASDLKVMTGSVEKRLEQRGEFHHSAEKMSALLSKIPRLESKTRLIMKYHAINDDLPDKQTGCIAFLVRLETHSSYRARERIRFSTILTNNGNSFHPGNSEFIAPLSGQYLFSVTIGAQPQKRASAEIVSDDKVLSRLASGYVRIKRASSSITVVVELVIGDKVFVRQTSDTSGDYQGHGFTQFSGTLMR